MPYEVTETYQGALIGGPFDPGNSFVFLLFSSIIWAVFLYLLALGISKFLYKKGVSNNFSKRSIFGHQMELKKGNMWRRVT